MLNQVVLVGRIIEEPEKIIDRELTKAIIKIEVQRAFKNQDGKYESDIIPVILWNMLADNIKEYCHIGDLVGIKARVQVKDGEMLLVADKVTFLAQKKEDKDGQQD